MSDALDVATTFAIRAAMPYGVRAMIILTRRITIDCAASTKVRIGDSSSSFSAITLRAAIPVSTPKITTAMIDVERAPVRSANGLVGIKLTSI